MEKRRKNVIRILLLLVILFSCISLFTGSSYMSLTDGISALLGKGTASNIRILYHIRIPRILAALIAGAGLSVAGLMMQTVLHNPMASPSTLGVSNAAVFGANLSIIAFSGGFLETGNRLSSYLSGTNPYATGSMAFVFALGSVLIILGLCRIRSFSPSVLVLAGVAMGSVWTAATTILQYYATDVGLSAAVIWSFGDLGRATYETDLIMLIPVLLSMAVFLRKSWTYNAMISGEQTASGLGVSVSTVRFGTLLLTSMVTAVCVSCLGIIGFVGIICPHVIKKLIGHNHEYSVVASALLGSLLLVCADTMARCLGNGSSLPVGAITSLLGAPFFLALILGQRRDDHA
ncbi:MAG: iron ABC transporter permease [Erysipelotrichaceae bacterium]|nr:iron ABC transporter permease [Erysipelotrichaceae bacterium]